MENWLIGSAIVVVLLLTALWPVSSSGGKLLRRWGIAEPRPDQVTYAVGYLRRRRVLFVLLYVTLSPAAVLLDRETGVVGGPFVFLVPLLVAMSLAELVAVVRPVRGRRVASLDPRGWRDLLPRWAVVVGAVLLLLTVTLSVIGLVGGRADTSTATSWVALAGAVLGMVLVGAVVHLAIRRPAEPDEALDAALRTRTARVAVAIGFGWLGAAVSVAGDGIDGLGPGVKVGLLVVQAAAFCCWPLLAMPTRRGAATVAG